MNELDVINTIKKEMGASTIVGGILLCRAYSAMFPSSRERSDLTLLATNYLMTLVNEREFVERDRLGICSKVSARHDERIKVTK